MNRKRWLLAAGAILMASCAKSPGPAVRSALPAGLPAGALEVAAALGPAELLDDTKALSADALEGRAPGSRGDQLATEYLARRLREIGCEPGFEGGAWEQPVEIVGVTAKLPERWAFRSAGGTEASFRLREDYMGGAGVAEPRIAIEDAEVVFVGYGIRAPEERWDDFKGADLRGKVLLMLNDDPDWDSQLFAGPRKLYYGRWTYKYESAAREGAAGAIIVHTTPSAGYPWDVVLNSWSGEQFSLPSGTEPRTPLETWLTEDAAKRLAALGGHDLVALIAQARSRDFRPVPLGIRTSIALENGVRRTRTANVAGILRGGDPARAGEFVVFTAHHDHLGVGQPDASGDRIYNGALDNGVAMAQVLAIARRFAALPARPARSLMFLFPAAEEQGTLGSWYFVRSGALSPDRIAANVNFELGNVWGRTRDVVVYGKGKSSLEDLLAGIARAQDRVVTEERDARAGWYYRSDQFSFAKGGIPAIWFRSGTDVRDKPAGWGDAAWDAWISTRYHRPSDEVAADWDLEGLAEDARLGFLLGLVVADGKERPAWYPGDEFARKGQQPPRGKSVKKPEEGQQPH